MKKIIIGAAAFITAVVVLVLAFAYLDKGTEEFLEFNEYYD